jgi:hypothetical protein
MHQLNTLVFGPNSFISTLIELKLFLKFNLHDDTSNLNSHKINYDVLIFHKDYLDNEKYIDIFKNTNSLKILATNDTSKVVNFDGVLKLPATLNEINFLVENLVAKKTFNKNSSINVKNYIIDKNEKKLIKDNNFIILTEKEIQLLELFLNHNKPITKDQIQSLVWQYSSETDTHTVETHIYRLRKKIADKFKDKNFILNSKDGYYI